MGRGILFKCKNCKKRYSVQFGTGMLFSEVYKETVDAIDKGKYGKEWQQLLRDTPNVIVDVKLELYICDKCRNWNCEENLSLYSPNEAEGLKEYPHICSKCGSVMKRVDEDNMPNTLPCPKCGTENEMDSIMMWD